MNTFITPFVPRRTAVNPLCTAIFCCLASFLWFAKSASATVLSLERAVQLAIENDPWMANSRYQEQALTAQSQAADALPDPTLSAGIANLPTNSFDFDQENMTQLKVGLTQQFPRGNTLRLNKTRLQLQAKQQPLQREIRTAQLTREVSKAWYQLSGETTLLQQLQQDRTLFEQLIQVAQTRYSSALQHTKQNSILLAELELARLDNQISRHQQLRASAMATLLQWLGSPSTPDSPKLPGQSVPANAAPPLPAITEWPASLSAQLQRGDFSALATLLSMHPELRSAQQQHKVSKVGIHLAQQRSAPQWGVSASYAYRDNNGELRNERADFVSLGFSVAVPLWNTEKNQHHVKAAKLQSEAVKTEHRLRQQQLLANTLRVFKEDTHLKQQTQRYAQTILPTLAQYTQATLTAFTNDDGKLEDVIRARIESRDARMALIQLQISRHQRHADMQYLLTGSGVKLNSSSSTTLVEPVASGAVSGSIAGVFANKGAQR